MEQRQVKVTLINGEEWLVSDDTFTHLGVSEPPKAIISNFIRGSRGPLIKVHSIENPEEFTYINANYIIKVDIKN